MTTIRWERTISDAITTARATGRPILVHYTEAPRCEACAKFLKRPRQVPLRYSHVAHPREGDRQVALPACVVRVGRR